MNEMNPELRFLIALAMIVFPVWWSIAVYISSKRKDLEDVSTWAWFVASSGVALATLSVLYGARLLYIQLFYTQ